MCGIAGVVGARDSDEVERTVARMTATLAHRGPDDSGAWAEGGVALGSRRLAVLDPTIAGHQPMLSRDQRFVVVYNGEIYNFVELRRELGGEFRTGTDTEVLIAALERWGDAAFHRFNGMFAFAAWDRVNRSLLLVRDRFGVKPLYYASAGSMLVFASELKALAAAGVDIESDLDTWRDYFTTGRYEHTEATFFEGIRRLSPGHCLTWRDQTVRDRRWYDLGAAVRDAGAYTEPEHRALEELSELATDSVRLRFRADVPVGVCVSGGLDSSLLVGLIERTYKGQGELRAYHFRTDDDTYDETPWVRELLAGRHIALNITTLTAGEVPELADIASYHQEEPLGGLATLAMTKLFTAARAEGTVALMDGQGVDEQWAGYDYYRKGQSGSKRGLEPQPVQGAGTSIRAECLSPDFLRGTRARTWIAPAPFGDSIANAQYRDLVGTKLPRALRFSDRSSSQASCELREPFLDHRLVEFAFRQPRHHVIGAERSKHLPRLLASQLVGENLATAPKRPVQTPQREWLRGPLRGWTEELVFGSGLQETGWFSRPALEDAWSAFVGGEADNSFFVWQWISAALHQQVLRDLRALA